MCAASVRFSYRPGLPKNPFRNVQLGGSWDASGRTAADWTFAPMQPTLDDDGCPAFDAIVNFDDSAIGAVLRWGVTLDGPLGPGLWGIASEVDDETSTARERSFTLAGGTRRTRSITSRIAVALARCRSRAHPAFVFPFGPPMRHRSISSSAIPRMAISLMTARALFNRLQWRRRTASGRRRSPIFRSLLADLTCFVWSRTTERQHSALTFIHANRLAPGIQIPRGSPIRACPPTLRGRKAALSFATRAK